MSLWYITKQHASLRFRRPYLRQSNRNPLFYLKRRGGKGEVTTKICPHGLSLPPSLSLSRLLAVSDGDVAVYGFDINQPSLPTPFYSVLVSISVFMALSTVFHSINSPDSCPLSSSVLPVLFFPYWSFQLYVSLRKSPLALI